MIDSQGSEHVTLHNHWGEPSESRLVFMHHVMQQFKQRRCGSYRTLLHSWRRRFVDDLSVDKINIAWVEGGRGGRRISKLANVAATFVFCFFVVHKEIFKGEEKYCVIGFYMTGGGAIHGNAHWLFSYCAIYVPCAAAALEHKPRARFSLRLEPCDPPLQASHHTRCQSSLFVARVINTVSSTLNVLGVRELFMLTIILWFFFFHCAAPNPGALSHSLW